MSERNPFAEIPLGICEELDMPAFATDQSCTSYPQRLAEVCGVIALPFGVAPPVDWTSMAGWAGVIDNADLTGTKARYLVGIGSHLPETEVLINLSGERLEEIRDRSYRLNYNVLNMNDGHMAFGRRLERGYKRYYVWLETLGGRLIGGPFGMAPVFVNARFPFNQGANSREVMQIVMDFFFLQFPLVTDSMINFDLHSYFWGTPGVDIWGDPDDNTGWGFIQ